MNVESNIRRQYTIKEAAKISGLPESTLRYYENIGLVRPIRRDVSSKHRIYNEDDINLIIAAACLNAIGLSIEDMHKYLENRENGVLGASGQIKLLESREKNIQEEMHYMQLRHRYIQSKIEYWKAMVSDDADKIKVAGELAYEIAREMKLPTSP